MARVAATQHGLLTSADFARAGISRRQIDTLVRSGAALMAVGDGSALSHRSGVSVWTVPGIVVDSIEVMVPRQRVQRVHRIKGIVVHRSTDLRDSHLRQYEGLVVTSPARTLVDVAGCLAPATVDRALEVITAR